MQLSISADRTVGAVQSDFSAAFPDLKIVFFSKPHRAYKGSAAKFLIDQEDLTLGQLSPGLKSGYLILEPDLAVWQVERLFETEYALHVQVFRRSGTTWLVTSVTDDLTLEQQQAKAAASDNIHPEFNDPIDYREQD